MFCSAFDCTKLALFGRSHSTRKKKKKNWIQCFQEGSSTQVRYFDKRRIHLQAIIAPQVRVKLLTFQFFTTPQMVQAKFSAQTGELLRLQAGFELNLKALNECHRKDWCACRMLTVIRYTSIFMALTARDSSYQHWKGAGLSILSQRGEQSGSTHSV